MRRTASETSGRRPGHSLRPEHRRSLAAILQKNFERLVGPIEAIVKAFDRDTASLRNHPRRTAEEARQKVAAERLARIAAQLRRELGDAEKIGLKVRFLDELDDAAPPFHDRLVADLKRLEAAAKRIATAAHKKTLRPRGRSTQERKPLVTQLHGVFTDAGVKVAKSSDGVFARCVEVVLDACGLPVPQDAYRLVANASNAQAAQKPYRTTVE